MMVFVDRIAKLRARKDLTLDEVVEQSDAVLQETATRQTRYAVSERPDVRTIRYYTTRGLLPKPLSYDGGRARYGYGHLVRLLAIKKMQSEHMTLEQIARAMDGKSMDELELLAGLVVREERPLPRGDVAPRPRAMGRARDDVTAGRSHARDLELELAPGGKVHVPAAVVGDPAARAQLADNLEQLARLLRAMGVSGGHDDGGSDG
jgi:DNA-binding transcriptional MerR regulator